MIKRSFNWSNFLGTEKPYDFNEVSYTPVPLGYVPIYINHLGRHGARYLTSDKEIEKIYKIFIKYLKMLN